MNWDVEQVKSELRGPAALMMAPFHDDLSLNLEALRDNIRFMMDAGMRTGRGFIICPCGTGEYTSLSPDEHRQMVETALEAAAGKLPVVAGAASLNLDDVVTLARNAAAAGARYVMIPAPCYYPVSQDDQYDWYRILSESVDAGIMIYDQSWRRDLGTTLGLGLIERLTELPSIVSLKYGSPNLFEQMIVALQRYADRYAFIDNSLGYTAALAHMHGGTGFISGPATWWPEFELEFFGLLEDGKYAEADRWHARLAPYMDLFGGEAGVAAKGMHHAAIVKASMEYVGLYGGPVRPPFRAMDAEQKRELFALLDRLGVKRAAAA